MSVQNVVLESKDEFKTVVCGIPDVSTIRPWVSVSCYDDYEGRYASVTVTSKSEIDRMVEMLMNVRNELND